MQFGEGSLSSAALLAANINPATGLATDYLNHFNEVAMLLGMLPDMPDIAEQVLEWTPLDYEGHFHNTGFRDKELAIDAYRHAPKAILNKFEAGKLVVEEAILEVQQRLRDMPDVAIELAQIDSARLFELISAVGGVINGRSVQEVHSPDQADIDSLFS